jgi:HD-GYP domain-containing protein (c-di-GMP phosphodiesterase class II)
MFGIIHDTSYGKRHMSDIALNTAVNKHFLDKLMRLAEAKSITATQDIVDFHGVQLIGRGTRIGAHHAEVLSGSKLKKSIESSLRVDDPVDTGLIVRTAECILDTSMPISRILGATGGSAAAPLAQLANMAFGDPMRMLLTMADHDGAHALEHAVSVSLLSICMARKLQLSEDDQQAAGLAGLLHDIGELYIAPAWLAPGKRLQPHEWAQLVMHPRLGQILVGELASYPAAVARAVAEHHERFDGSGYPRQAPGKRISAVGQAVSVAEMIAGVLGKDHPLERAELALKIIPGEHARELVSAISDALRMGSGSHQPEHVESGGREDSRRLFRRLGAALEQGQDLLDGPGARSPHACDLLVRTLERIRTIQRAFISTGMDAYLNLDHSLHAALDGVLLFEKAVVTREIQWRLRDIARDLALHTAGSPDEKSQFASLIELLDDDSDTILQHVPNAPKVAALSPASFAGSQAYAS